MSVQPHGGAILSNSNVQVNSTVCDEPDLDLYLVWPSALILSYLGSALIAFLPVSKETENGDFLGGPVVKNLLGNAGSDEGSVPRVGIKVPRAAEQLSLSTATPEPASHKQSVHTPQRNGLHGTRRSCVLQLRPDPAKGMKKHQKETEDDAQKREEACLFFTIRLSRKNNILLTIDLDIFWKGQTRSRETTLALRRFLKATPNIRILCLKSWGGGGYLTVWT